MADPDALAAVAAELELGPDERRAGAGAGRHRASGSARSSRRADDAATRHRRPSSPAERAGRHARRPRRGPAEPGAPSSWPTSCAGSTTPGWPRSGARSGDAGVDTASDLEVLVLGGLTHGRRPRPVLRPLLEALAAADGPMAVAADAALDQPLGDGEEAYGIVADGPGRRPAAGPRVHRRPRRRLRGLSATRPRAGRPGRRAGRPLRRRRRRGLAPAPRRVIARESRWRRPAEVPDQRSDATTLGRSTATIAVAHAGLAGQRVRPHPRRHRGARHHRAGRRVPDGQPGAEHPVRAVRGRLAPGRHGARPSWRPTSATAPATAWPTPCSAGCWPRSVRSMVVGAGGDAARDAAAHRGRARCRVVRADKARARHPLPGHLPGPAALLRHGPGGHRAAPGPSAVRRAGRRARSSTTWWSSAPTCCSTSLRGGQPPSLSLSGARARRPGRGHDPRVVVAFTAVPVLAAARTGVRWRPTAAAAIPTSAAWPGRARGPASTSG